MEILKLSELKIQSENWKSTPVMPIIFIGHGSPLNAIEYNNYTQTWRKISENLPKPIAIVVISALWQTNGSKVTAMPKPKTIHDFYGFPKELFEQQYNAPGDSELAHEISGITEKYTILEDHTWGLDHGSWSVLVPMFPKANIPVLQLSLDKNLSPQQHFDLSKELFRLRKKELMVLFMLLINKLRRL